MSDRLFTQVFYVLVAITCLGIGISLWLISQVGPDFSMGDIQKILYFHVSCAWLTLISAALGGFCGIFFLRTKSAVTQRFLLSFLELAGLFGLCVLITGPLWGKKSWGTFWVWDARVTSTLVLFLTTSAARFAYKHAGHMGPSLAAALSVFGLINVPLVYLSVKIAKTIHPPVSTVWTLSGPMKTALLSSIGSFSLLFVILIWLRSKVYQLQEELQLFKMEIVHE